MIEYCIAESVRAFTVGRGEVLPFEVTQAHQVHGCEIAVIDRPGMTREELEGYDALVTDLKECAVGVRTADCIPVLLYDPVHRAVAAVHAGWRGTLTRISQKTISRMTDVYGTLPADLKAVIGPGICRRCFQVGEEVVDAFRKDGFTMDGICSWNGEKVEGILSTGHHLDLMEINRRTLVRCGVLQRNIQVSGICTYEDTGLFSARRDGTKCGRNINAIVLV